MNFPPTSPPITSLARRNALPALNRIHSRGRKIAVPRGGKMDGSVVREKIANHGMRNSSPFGIGHEFIVDAPAAKAFTEAEKNACSIDAMMNGGECEACQ